MGDLIIQRLIDDTLGGLAKWEFVWGFFTPAKYFFPMFIGKDGNGQSLKIVPEFIVAPDQPMFAVMLYVGDDAYWSDTEEFLIEQGMDLWVSVENKCTNNEFFMSEMQKRVAEAQQGRKYPTVDTEGAQT